MKKVNKFAVGIFTMLAVALVGLVALALYPHIVREGWTGELIAIAFMPTPVLGFVIHSGWEYRYHKVRGNG